MTTIQEFLVIRKDQRVGVYGVGQLPAGTVIAGDAERLRVSGAAPIRPPKVELPGSEFERWYSGLSEMGYDVSLGPFWTDPIPAEESLKSLPLQDAFDELLREADGRREAQDRPVGAVESRHP